MKKPVLFYDSRCPLCLKEIKWLKKGSRAESLVFVDIFDNAAMAGYPEVDASRALDALHMLMPDGKLLLGLDATAMSWRLSGRGRWIEPLRWPVIRILSDAGYRVFARYRHLFIPRAAGHARCETNVCKGAADDRHGKGVK